MSHLERRFHSRAELRLEGAAEGPGLLAGYAVVYDSPSEDLGGFTELIRPGCFAETLKAADVRCLIDHNSSLLLGRSASKTLRLFDEAAGLRIECDLPDTSYARDLARVIARGDLSGMSFGFVALEDSWDMGPDGKMVRTVVKAEIFDVSAVTYPAYPETSLAVRSLDAWKAARHDPDETRRLRLKLAEAVYRPR
jgi:hypothetical protein